MRPELTVIIMAMVGCFFPGPSGILFAQDCNGNGIPDECDIDCGAPGGPCDVPGCGGSADCNDNGVPDECEPPAAVIHVNAGATGANDGSSWEDAYTCLQDALAEAGPITGSVQIWVAAQTYAPDQGVAQTPGDRDATFQLIDCVLVYGGFGGWETELDQRDPTTNVTVLSGEIGGVGEADNSYHVVTASGTNATAVLDGFTISAGNASGSGARGNGGGMYNEGGRPNMAYCTFSGNSASYGGGMYSTAECTPALTMCTFTGNSATTNHGGGMYNGSGSNPTLTDCVFIENAADDNGGGVYCHTNSDPMLVNCTFSGNSAASGGGIECYYGSPTLTNCTFNGNSAERGGGMYAYGDEAPVLVNCVFAGNSAGQYGGGVCALSHNAPMLTNCVFAGNSADDYYGGGMFSGSYCTPSLVNCTFSGNLTNGNGGGIYSSGSSLTVTNCILWGDDPEEIYAYSGTTTVRYSDVADGTGEPWFGEGCVDDDPGFIAGPGGTWTTAASYDPQLGQTTFIDDTATWENGELVGEFLNPDTSQALRSLVVANTATIVTVWGDFELLGAPETTYQINDYRLGGGPPCTDAADNTAVPPDEADLDEDGDVAEQTPLDLDYNPRFVDDPEGETTGVESPEHPAPDIVDMGAYEFQVTTACELPGDVNGDTFVNGSDIQGFTDCALGGGGDGNCLCGDFDGDHAVDTDDIEDFVFTLLFGETPACECPGDLNDDGSIDGGDIHGFITCALGGGAGQNCVCGDFDGNEEVDAADVEGFVSAVLSGGPCP
ncbi:MAG: right-handed parallel beta-helix repeat-containing protein [Phycisphaerae bacterium]|nr:right-handed parallel beta-helix repeat-containing protein [Phycisphaerae bacterium]